MNWSSKPLYTKIITTVPKWYGRIPESNGLQNFALTGEVDVSWHQLAPKNEINVYQAPLLGNQSWDKFTVSCLATHRVSYSDAFLLSWPERTPWNMPIIRQGISHIRGKSLRLLTKPFHKEGGWVEDLQRKFTSVKEVSQGTLIKKIKLQSMLCPNLSSHVLHLTMKSFQRKKKSDTGAGKIYRTRTALLCFFCYIGRNAKASEN